MTERKSFDLNAISRRKQPVSAASTNVHTPVAGSPVATLIRPTLRSAGLPDLPTVKTNAAAPVATVVAGKNTAVRSARSIAASKRNSGPRDTERQHEILRFLSRTPIARAEHVKTAVSKFQYEHPMNGTVGPASLKSIKNQLSMLCKRGLVEWDNSHRGCTVYFLTEEGSRYIGVKPLVRNRRIQLPDGKWTKKPQLPATRHWQHTLGLAALQALFIKEGYVFAHDGLMEKALNERNADGKQTYIAVPKQDFLDDPMYGKADWDLAEEYAAYFSMPKGVGKSHRADLVVLLPNGPTAVELELSRKNTAAISENIQAYVRALHDKRIAHVVYYGPENIIKYVEHVMKQCTAGAPHMREKFQFELYDPEAFASQVPF